MNYSLVASLVAKVESTPLLVETLLDCTSGTNGAVVVTGSFVG